MVKSRELSEATRMSIVELSNGGKSQSEIATQLKISKSTISDTLARYRSRGTIQNLPRTGRPRCTTSRIDQKIVRMAENSDKPCAVDIAKELAKLNIVSVHPNTVKNRLKETGLQGRVLVKKPLLLPRHIKARVEFAKQYQNWTKDDWAKVIWSDETKICLHGSDGRRWTWKRPDEPLQNKHVKQTIKFDKSVMAWGCFSRAGVGDICIIEDKLTSAKYVRILSTHMQPSAARLVGPEYIFQQDNDPKHTANNTKGWLSRKNIHVLQWPAQSPDLNPIENLWSHLKQEIRKAQVTGMDELVEKMQECWKSISPDYCERLVDSMPSRIDQVLRNRGLWTKY